MPEGIPDPTDALLASRRNTHGDYAQNAEMIQKIMRILETARCWGQLSDVHREGIHMIIHKIARAVNGDSMEPDHFDDVAGYAKLITRWIRMKIPKSPDVEERRVPRSHLQDLTPREHNDPEKSF